MRSLVIGETIGVYRVSGKLGEGGMGVVYLGEHALLGRKAAIKVLLPELSAHHDIVKRFFNEARAVTQIADPGIVQVFDFGYHTDGSAYFIMELLEGEPIDKRLARIGCFHPLDALRLVRLVCGSLHQAHGKGIVHRDLKPENIFIVGDPAVTGGERAKILDFGIAKLTAEEPGKTKTRTGMVMGTPVYMSPEQCRGAGDVDHRSDIYALGCVLFAMLTGRPPFEGEGAGELIAAHLREPPPRATSKRPELPAVLDPLLERCLAKAPGDRFGSMAELAQAIAQAEQQIAGEPARTLLATTPMALPLPAPPVTELGTAATTPVVRTAILPVDDEPAPRRGRGGVIAAITVGAIVFVGLVVLGTAWKRHQEAPAASVAEPSPEPLPEPVHPPVASARPPVASAPPPVTSTPAVDAGVSADQLAERAPAPVRPRPIARSLAPRPQTEPVPATSDIISEPITRSD